MKRNLLTFGTALGAALLVLHGCSYLISLAWTLNPTHYFSGVNFLIGWRVAMSILAVIYAGYYTMTRED